MNLQTALSIALAIGVFGLIGMAAITGIRRGWDPDVTGSRPRALYIYGVTLVALVVAAFSIAALANAITQIILPSGISAVPGLVPSGALSDKASTNEAVQSGLLAVGALLVFLFQFRKGNQ